MAPAPPTCRRSDRPRSTPSRRRVTRDDPISTGKGARHHCGRSTSVVGFPLQDKRQERGQQASNQDQPKHHTKTPTKLRPHPENQTPTTTHANDGKKKNWCGSRTLMYERKGKNGSRSKSVRTKKSHKGKPKPRMSEIYIYI